jgi:hypothetical protein
MALYNDLFNVESTLIGNIKMQNIKGVQPTVIPLNKESTQKDCLKFEYLNKNKGALCFNS